MAMETTEDQIVFLTSDGLIQRYTLNESRLILKNEQIISNSPKWEHLIPFKMISTNTDQTIVLERFILTSGKPEISVRYILTPKDNNQLKMIPMEDKNIVLLTKIKYMNKKRIAIISNNPIERFRFFPRKVNLISDKPRENH